MCAHLGALRDNLVRVCERGVKLNEGPGALGFDKQRARSFKKCFCVPPFFLLGRNRAERESRVRFRVDVIKFLGERQLHLRGAFGSGPIGSRDGGIGARSGESYELAFAFCDSIVQLKFARE